MCGIGVLGFVLWLFLFCDFCWVFWVVDFFVFFCDRDFFFLDFFINVKFGIFVELDNFVLGDILFFCFWIDGLLFGDKLVEVRLGLEILCCVDFKSFFFFREVVFFICDCEEIDVFEFDLLMFLRLGCDIEYCFDKLSLVFFSCCLFFGEVGGFGVGKFLIFVKFGREDIELVFFRLFRVLFWFWFWIGFGIWDCLDLLLGWVVFVVLELFFFFIGLVVCGFILFDEIFFFILFLFKFGFVLFFWVDIVFFFIFLEICDFEVFGRFFFEWIFLLVVFGWDDLRFCSLDLVFDFVFVDSGVEFLKLGVGEVFIDVVLSEFIGEEYVDLDIFLLEVFFFCK